MTPTLVFEDAEDMVVTDFEESQAPRNVHRRRERSE
jgi:hypothetical protein